MYFEVDKHNFVQVYTAGSCSNNFNHNGRAGIGISFGNWHTLNVAARLEGYPQTSCRAEIQAATKAIRIAATQRIPRLTINTDSQYVINAVNKWIPKWKEYNWGTFLIRNVCNGPDFRKLDRALSDNRWMEVQWCHVPAHEGYEGNEGADRLAKQGAMLPMPPEY